MSEQFTRHRSRPIALALAANLGRLSRSASALHVGAFRGHATVIGGGPSIERLSEVDRASFTLTVNTAAPKVCGAFAPDALVIREVVDVGEQLTHLTFKPRKIILDVQTAPATVERAHDVADVLWCIPAQSHLSWLFRLLDVRPVYGGESAMTMAVALTEGSESTTLLGCDLCFGRDGEAYGGGTAWDGVRVSSTGTLVDFGDRGGMQLQSRASGVPAPLLREQATPVLREDGTEALALATWCSQRLWLEQWATRHERETTFRNLSHGAKIEGWRPEPVRAWAGFLRSTPLAISKIDGEVRRQLALARETLRSDAPWTLGSSLLGHPLVDMAAARDIQETSDRGLPLKVALGERKPILERAIEAVEAAYAGAA